MARHPLRRFPLRPRAVAWQKRWAPGSAPASRPTSRGPGMVAAAADRPFEAWRRGWRWSAAALAWDVLGIDSGPHQYHLTISALAQAYRPLNAALLLVWILVGIGYEAARVRAPFDDTGTPRDGGGPQGPEYRGTFVAALGPLGAQHGSSALLLPQSPPVGIVFWVAVPVVAVLIDAALVVRTAARRRRRSSSGSSRLQASPISR